MKKKVNIALLSSSVTLLTIAIVFVFFYFWPNPIRIGNIGIDVSEIGIYIHNMNKAFLSSQMETPPSYITLNTELFEGLGLVDSGVRPAGFIAHSLYMCGVQEIVDISFEKVAIETDDTEFEHFYHRVQVTDSEGNDYFFTLNDAGQLGHVRKGDENGEVIWEREPQVDVKQFGHVRIGEENGIRYIITEPRTD